MHVGCMTLIYYNINIGSIYYTHTYILLYIYTIDFKRLFWFLCLLQKTDVTGFENIQMKKAIESMVYAILKMKKTFYVCLKETT